jgi:thiosulfate dehydrogenase [quinone] large subunit
MNNSMSSRNLAYLVFRLVMGVNMLSHGVVRIFSIGVGNFASKTATQFAGTLLPIGMVQRFLFVLPFVEAILGILIILGLFSRAALAISGLLIGVLVLGTGLRNDWATVSIQLIYAIGFYLLLANENDNWFSLDALRSAGKKAEEQKAMARSAGR